MLTKQQSTFKILLTWIRLVVAVEDLRNFQMLLIQLADITGMPLRKIEP